MFFLQVFVFWERTITKCKEKRESKLEEGRLLWEFREWSVRSYGALGLYICILEFRSGVGVGIERSVQPSREREKESSP